MLTNSPKVFLRELYLEDYYNPRTVIILMHLFDTISLRIIQISFQSDDQYKYMLLLCARVGSHVQALSFGPVHISNLGK